MHKLANVLSGATQTDVATRLRQLADDIDAGRVQLTDLYASANVLDTTPAGSAQHTTELDHTSHMFLLRFARPAAPASAEGLYNLEQYLRAAVERGQLEHALRVERHVDGTTTFSIRPLDADEELHNFEVRGNLLRPAPRATLEHTP